jgi:hypothetical protein
MSYKRLTAGSLLTALLVLAIPVSGLAAPPSWFDQGKEAFRKGDYQNAARAFEQARKAGVHRVALYYNLGVS